MWARHFHSAAGLMRTFRYFCCHCLSFLYLFLVWFFSFVFVFIHYSNPNKPAEETKKLLSLPTTAKVLRGYVAAQRCSQLTITQLASLSPL